MKKENLAYYGGEKLIKKQLSRFISEDLHVTWMK